MKMIKTLMLIIKITNNCNLKCTYCYDKNKQINDETMNLNKLEEVIKWSVSYAKNCNIDLITYVWHGGEPLLAGEDFFNQVIFLQKKYLFSIKYRNGIQTNGTLISDNLAEFFKINKFQISISLDGNKEITNTSRRYNNRIGAYDSIINGINILRNHNVKCGISMVIHEGNVNQLIEIYNYFKSQNMNFDFVPSFSAELDKEYLEQFATNMVELFDYWYHDENCLSIGFFNDLIRSIVTGKIYHCNFERQCCFGDSILVIELNGDLYPCSTLALDNTYCFGNISEIVNKELIENSQAYKTINEINDLSAKECNECDVKQYCNSGCFVRSLRGIPKDFYCKGWYNLINYTLNILVQDKIILDRSRCL